ncbi:MAG: helicase HerA-like domain-containing protein [Pirellula sp.]
MKSSHPRGYACYAVATLVGIALLPLATKLLAIFFGSTSISPLHGYLPFVVMLAIAMVIQLLASFKRFHWIILGCFVIAFFWQSSPTLVAILMVAGHFAWFIPSFRKHYTEYCLAAPIPASVAASFRQSCVIPANVTPIPKIADFWNAIECWFEYNIDDHRLPGIFQSPAGYHWVRLISSAALVTLITITLPHFILLQLAHISYLGPIELLLGIVFAHCTPILVLGLGLFIWCFPILGKAGGLLRSASLANYWSDFQNDVSNSANTIERDSLFLGQVVADSSPILATLKTANSHWWIAGATGAGKTALLMFVLEQFIRRGYSVGCMDLKADSFELYYTQLASATSAAGLNLPTWYFTNRSGWATQFCSPFEHKFWKLLAPVEKTNVHLSAMGIGFSRDYGESWFSDATYTVLDYVNHKYPNIAGYQELHDRITYELAHALPHDLSKSVKKDGEQAALIIRRLKAVEMFNPTSQHSQTARDAALDIGDLFTRQGLAYWGLNPLISPIGASEISRVVLGTILAAATSAKLRKRNLLLVIDEFQQMVAPGVLQLALRQARSLGITVLLLNQTVDDLKTAKNNFVPTVEGNTAIQMWLNAPGRDAIDQIQRLGGKYIDHLHAEAFDAQGNRRVSKQEVLVDRYDATTISRVSSERGQYIVRITNNDGYAQYNGIPFVAQADFHLTSTEYLRRCSAPWPAQTAQSVIVGQAAQTTLLPAASVSATPNTNAVPLPLPVPMVGRTQRRVIGSGTLGPRNP